MLTRFSKRTVRNDEHHPSEAGAMINEMSLESKGYVGYDHEFEEEEKDQNDFDDNVEEDYDDGNF